MKHNGKPVLITGASRGIGQATAELLASQGYFVGIHYHKSREPAQEAASKINASGGKAVAICADLRNNSQAENMIDEFAGEAGWIYGLVNNAGIYQRKPFSEISEEDWHDTIALNLNAVFYATKAALKHMKTSEPGAECPAGRIVNIASVLGHMGSSQGAHYAATKAALLSFTRSLAQELAPQITVNCVAPGAINTDIIAGDTTEKRRQREAMTPLGRVGEPEEIASVIAFLLSDDASYITGEVLNANGGLFLH